MTTQDAEKREMNALIAVKMEAALGLIAEAQEIAVKHELEFHIDLAYGMGGTFSDGEWHPSSQSC